MTLLWLAVFLIAAALASVAFALAALERQQREHTEYVQGLLKAMRLEHRARVATLLVDGGHITAAQAREYLS